MNRRSFMKWVSGALFSLALPGRVAVDPVRRITPTVSMLDPFESFTSFIPPPRNFIRADVERDAGTAIFEAGEKVAGDTARAWYGRET